MVCSMMAEEATTRLFRPLQVFLCGDVMTGRGIDQVLPSQTMPASTKDT